MRQYITVCFVSDCLKQLINKGKQVKLEHKKMVIEELQKDWSEQEVKLYCANHPIDGINSGFTYLTPKTIPYHILEQNRSLFSNEEYEEAKRSIDVQKTLKRG